MRPNVFILLALALAATACATGGLKNKGDARLIGVRAPLISDGIAQSIYFTHLDNRELRSVFDQYPTSIDVAPGSHLVTVVCEWREKAGESPVAKHVRRFKMDVEAARVIQFESSFEGAGNCQLAWKDVTDQKTAAPGK